MYDNNNTIVLFKNDKKGNDKRPDYKGSLNIEGVEKDVSMWLSETKNGDKYLNGKIQDKFDKEVKVDLRKNAPSKYESGLNATDDDIPF